MEMQGLPWTINTSSRNKAGKYWHAKIKDKGEMRSPCLIPLDGRNSGGDIPIKSDSYWSCSYTIHDEIGKSNKEVKKNKSQFDKILV